MIRKAPRIAKRRDLTFSVRVLADLKGSAREARLRAEFLVEKINEVLQQNAEIVHGAQLVPAPSKVEVINRED